MSVRIARRSAWIALFLTCCFLGTATAQEVGRLGDVMAEGVSYHTYARPGEATVQVFVLGDIPGGIYEVSAETTLDELIALMGGAGGEEQADAKREITVRLIRGNDVARNVIYEVPIERIFLDRANYPRLADNDILEFEVKYKKKFSWRDAISVLTSAGTLFLIVDRVINGY